MLNIVTIGSIFSCSVAERLSHLINAKQQVSIINSRTDIFYEHFVVGRYSDSAHQQMLQLLSDEDELVQLQLAEQDKKNLGRIGDGKTFFDLDARDIDLIILDNKLDQEEIAYGLTAAAESNHYVLPSLKNTAILDHKNLLAIDEYRHCLQKNVEFLQKKFPQAKIVVINFPIHHYKNIIMRLRNKERFEEVAERAMAFEAASNIEGIIHIPILDIPRAYQAKDDNIFTEHLYCAYSGMIFNSVVLSNRNLK